MSGPRGQILAYNLLVHYIYPVYALCLRPCLLSIDMESSTPYYGKLLLIRRLLRSTRKSCQQNAYSILKG